MLVNFTNEEKIKIFDNLAPLFFEKNFGRLSKADMEAFMFHYYFEKVLEDSKIDSDLIDYNKCSDYKIGKDLGITQQKVKNLKIMNELLYPSMRDWKKDFASLTKNARYDKTARRIILNIPDPNLYLELQNYIEEQGGYIEKQLNGKILQIRPEYYIELITYLETEDNRKKIIKELKGFFKDKGKDDEAFDAKNIGKSFLETGLSAMEAVTTITGCISSTNVIGTAFVELIKQFI